MDNVGPIVDPLVDPTARPTVNEGWDGFDGPAFVDSELEHDFEDDPARLDGNPSGQETD